MNASNLTHYLPIIGPLYSLFAHRPAPLVENANDLLTQLRTNQSALQSIGLVNTITHLFFAAVFVLPTAIHSVAACALFASVALLSATQSILCGRIKNSLLQQNRESMTEQEAILGLNFLFERACHHLNKHLSPEDLDGLKKHLSEVRTGLSTSKHEKELAPYVQAVSKILNQAPNEHDSRAFMSEVNGIQIAFKNLENQILRSPREIQARKNDLATLLENLSLYKDPDENRVRPPLNWINDYRNWRLINRVSGLLSLRKNAYRSVIQCSVTQLLSDLNNRDLFCGLPTAEDLRAIQNSKFL